jgi:hypothetical protein
VARLSSIIQVDYFCQHLTATVHWSLPLPLLEDDDPSLIEAAVQRHLANVQGLFIQSDVDMLPLGPRAED